MSRENARRPSIEKVRSILHQYANHDIEELQAVEELTGFRPKAYRMDATTRKKISDKIRRNWAEGRYKGKTHKAKDV